MKEHMEIELTGQIDLVTYRGKKETGREELDGEICLLALARTIEEAVMAIDIPKKKKSKRTKK